MTYEGEKTACEAEIGEKLQDLKNPRDLFDV
jgi:hypothetical protein